MTDAVPSDAARTSSPPLASGCRSVRGSGRGPLRRAAIRRILVPLAAGLAALAGLAAAAQAPGPPASFVATPGDQEVVLTWATPSEIGGSAITRYDYRWKAADAETVPDWASVGLATRVVVDELTNGRSYEFQVRAANSAGAGNAAQTFATPVGPPGAPSGLSADPGDGQVLLSWTAPAQDGGAAITGYEYRWRTATGEDIEWTAVEGTSTTVPGLENGVGYTFAVRAVNAAGLRSEPASTAETTPRGVPDMPGEFEAVADDGSVELSWSEPADNGSPLLRYVYTWKESDAATFADARERLPGQTAATVVGLRNGVEYVFRVRAVNAAGDSPEAEATATPRTAPDAPANLTATPGNRQVELTWDPPASDGGAEITGYEYRWRATTGEDIDWTDVDGTSTTVSGLKNGIGYTIDVRAVNAADLRGESATAEATPRGVPARPPDFEAVADDASVQLSWSKPEDNGAPILRYVYGFKALNDPGFVERQVPPNQTRVPVAGLANGTEYVFQVRAVNAAGDGPVAEATATPAALPDPPADLTAEAGNREVTLSWHPPASDGGAAIAKYEYRWRAGSGAYRPWINAGDVRTVTVRSLENGVTHVFQVVAVNAAGRSNEATATAVPVTIAGAPQDFTASAGDGQVELAWDPPRDTGGLAVSRYEYRFGPARSAFGQWQTAGTTAATVTGLDNGTTYAFEVRAVTRAGPGPAASAEAMPLAMADAPRELAADAADRSVVLRWQPPLDNGGSEISGYFYRWRPDGGGFAAWTSAGVAETVTVGGLENGIVHHFEVRAQTGAGPGHAATATATPRGVPGAPEELAARAASGRVALEWQPPAFDGGAAVSDYEYRFKAAGDAFGTWQGIGLARSATVVGLVNGRTYTFEVRAVNVAGAGAAAEASASPTGIPTAPENLAATPGDGGATLAWEEPVDDGGAEVESYQYRWRPADGAFVDWRSAGLATTVAVADLTNGVRYLFEVRAVNAVGAGLAATVEATPAAPATAPSAPRELRATPGDGRLTLGWSAPSDDGGAALTHYEYRWGVVDDAFGQWTNGGLDRVAEVGDLDNGVAYRVEVRAVNAAGPGPPAVAEGTPQAAPGAPENLEATVGDGSVTLTWDAPLDGGGLVLVRYEYRFHAAGEPATASWTDAGTRTTATIAELVNGRSYVFEVRAVNAAFAGRAASVAATPGTVPGAPEVTATAGDGEVVLRWQPPSTLGGAPLLRYEHRTQRTGGVFGPWANVGGATTTTVRGLANDIEHAFEVRAVTRFGHGSPGRATATPRAAVAPATPVVSAEAGDAAVTLRWDEPDHGGAAIERYEYRWQPEGGAFGQWTRTGLERTASVTGLVNGVAHTFEVRAVNQVGPGDAGRVAATPAGTPGAPEIEARAGSRVVDLRWRAPDDNGSRIIAYGYRWGPASEDLGDWVDAGAQTAVTIRGLDNGTTYAFEVRARNAMGHGPAGSATATPSPNLRDDILAQAWLSRFGRASTEHIVDAVAARATAPARPDATARRREAERTRRGRRPATGRVEHRGPGDQFGWLDAARAAPGLSGFDQRQWSATRADGWDAVLGTVAAGQPAAVFSLSTPSGGGQPSAGAWAAWGRLSGTRFAGEQGPVAVDGGVVTGTLGADYRRGRILAGLALSHSSARGDFRQLARGGYPARSGDEVTSRVSGIYPYMRYQGRWLSAWGVLGGGQGSLSLGGEPPQTDTRIVSVLGAAGAAGQLASVAGVDLGIRTDAFVNRVATAGDDDADGDELADVVASTGRLRLALAASRAFLLDGGGAFETSFEVGGRHDSGDAETGFGVEVGGGVRLIGARRLTLEARGRTIVAHQDATLQAWSGMLSVLADAGGGGPDLALRFGPAWDDDGLWRADAAGGRRYGRPGSERVNAEVGYRLPSRSGTGTSRPYAAMRFAAAGRGYRFGWQRAWTGAEVELAGAARQAVHGAWRYGVLVRATARPGGERFR